jgi:LacI family transcriptional regulator, repressor for deo operon, udp, cdd, tsx, nupC, and nupG
MTVSRVINGSPQVRKETRERVLRAIEELSYTPNAAAQALSSKRARSIGIVFPRTEYLLTAPFYIELLVELEGRLKQNGYHLFLGSMANEDESKDLPGHFGEGKVDGLILFAPESGDEGIARLMERRLPFVVAFGRSEARDFSFVDSDNAAGAALVMNHLFELGHRRIGFVAGSMREQDAVDRFAGYRSGLASRGLPLEDQLVYRGDWSLESGYKAFITLMRRSAPPTAIFFSNDQMAIGAIKASQDLGLRIPEDVSITGYDDIRYAAFLTPPLTTVRQNISAAGTLVAELILEQVEGKQEPRHIIFEPELVIRRSCRSISS